MDWITTSGSSIDEAKSNALDQLGIVADEAEFDVINDVEKNFLGRVKVEARVRARVRPRQPAAKDERHRRSESRNKGGSSRRRSRGGKGRGDGRSGETDVRTAETSSPGGKATRSGGAESKPARSGNDRAKGDGRKGDGRKGDGRKGDGDKRRRREPVKSPAADAATASEQSAGNGTVGADGARQQQAKRGAVDHEFSRQEQERVAVDFLEGVLGAFELDGSVAVAEDIAEDDAIEVEVTGAELGLLVGHKGATLNALQELTRTVVQREADGARTERLRVDVAGYRERRRAALAEFARGIATDVLETGSEKVLEPMGPADRKVVHDTVNEMDGVETGSEGEEPRRRVVIRPA